MKQSKIIKKTLKRSLWLFWDNIGLLMLVNFFCFCSAWTIIAFPSAVITCFYLCRKIISNKPEQIGFMPYLKQIKTLFFIKTFHFIFLGVLLFLFSFNLFFYTQIHITIPIILITLLGAAFWMLILYSSFLLYFLPLLEKKSFFNIENPAKAAMLALLKYPFATLGVLLSLIITNLGLLLSVAGVFAFILTFNIMVATNLSYIIFCEIEQNKENEYLEAVDKRRFVEIFSPFSAT